MVSALAASFGSCCAFKAEIMALHRGLELARSLRIGKLMVQLDSLSCVQTIQSTTPSSGECAHVIDSCRSLINDSQWEVRVSHVYREGNRAADWLANLGETHPHGIVILEETPLALRRILIEDIQGVAVPRLIPP